jgi:hypothetical protein
VVWKKAKIFVVKAFSISDKQGLKSKFHVSVLGSHPLYMMAKNTKGLVGVELPFWDLGIDHFCRNRDSAPSG